MKPFGILSQTSGEDSRDNMVLDMDIGDKSRRNSTLPRTEHQNHLENLPDPILNMILSKLDRQSLLNLSEVSIKFALPISPLELNDLPTELLLSIFR